MNTNTLHRTLRTLAALTLHQTALTLRGLSMGIRPKDVYIPEGAPITVTTSPWAFIPRTNHLVIEGVEEPIHAFSNHVVKLPGFTVVTTTDNSGCGSDDPHIYVLMTSQEDPGVLDWRDEDGYFRVGDTHDVV